MIDGEKYPELRLKLPNKVSQNREPWGPTRGYLGTQAHGRAHAAPGTPQANVLVRVQGRLASASGLVTEMDSGEVKIRRRVQYQGQQTTPPALLCDSGRPIPEELLGSGTLDLQLAGHVPFRMTMNHSSEPSVEAIAYL